MNNYMWQFFIFTGVAYTALMLKMLDVNNYDLKDTGIVFFRSPIPFSKAELTEMTKNETY